VGVRVLLVDDHAMFRAGVKSLLAFNPEFEIVGEADSGQQALDKVREVKPDIVIMDIAMPGMDGLSATRLIKELHPEVKVLLLSQHENREYILPALKMGASGYVLKRAAADELIQAVKSINAGKSYLDPDVADIVVNDYRYKKTGADDSYDSLTEREREVLIYLARGRTNREIAEILCISLKTVDFHKGNLMRKLEIHNRVELTKYAMHKGLV
jgi:NarL family two-component system response regulator LiaR